MDNSLNPTGDSFGASNSPVAPIYRNLSFGFTGQTGEYFRIWIVNMLLTLVTFGFYTPWARVRSRRYFHANTHLDGHSFDYLAKPINIFWGYLIVLVVVGGYYTAGFFNPIFTIPFILMYIFFGPWVVYKAMRFKAHNTSYRNVRFEFHGTVGDAYAIYLGMAILIPLTFGLIVPYWIMKQKEYFYKNLSFGGRQFDFTPEAGEYYTRYILGGVMSMAMFFIYMFVFGAIMLPTLASGEPIDPENIPISFYLSIYLGYAPLMLGMVFVQIYIFVSLFNYNLGRMLVQQTAFESKLKVGKFYWISLTNILAIVFSLGLLAPWAAIRKTRYFAESVDLVHPGAGLGEFVAGRENEVSAIGDAAADVFEFDIGW
ncbi:conserved hypothetical protein [Verrucomicrobiia bacterium DG1235]|nr:conserved hypothetical protein [Verrucomicrobiae bacterium DG1235]